MNRTLLRRSALLGALLAALGVTEPGYAAAQSGGADRTSPAVPTALAGRVVEAGTGRPVEGATVTVVGVDREETRVRHRTVTTGDGAWRLGPLEQGRWTLEVRHLGFAPVERTVDLSFADAPAAPVTVALTPRPLALDALVVTAGRREQRLADVVVATEIVSAREIDETGASDLAAVLTERAGIELQGGHPVGAGLMIQGLGSERVLVLLDGQPFIGRVSGTIDVSRIPTSMIERVEIVKGPQSTLYGSEAMGGVVNVLTRTPPSASWTTGAAVAAGDQGRLDVAANAVGGAGPLTGLVDVGRRSLDRTPGWEGDAGARSTRWDGLLKLGWRTPVEGLRLETSGLLLDERQRWRSGQLWHFADNRQWSGTLTGRWTSGPHTLSPALHLTAFDHVSRSATRSEPVDGTGERETQRLAEAELLWTVDLDAHGLDLGVEARREAIRSDRVRDGERDETAVEAFAQATVGLGELTVVPGLRATYSDPWGGHWTPRVAALYRPVPDLALRGSLGRGFRVPAFKELYMEFLNVGPGFGYTVRGNPELGPETSTNVTLGAEWAGRRTWLRAQAFRNDFEDFIETRAVGDSSGVTVYTYGNVDDGTTRGVEAEGGLHLGGWRLEGGHSLLRAQRATTGEALLGRPRSSSRLTFGHVRPDGIRLSLTGVRTGRTAMARTATETVWREAFLRFDVRAARELPGGLRIAAGVDNLLDARVRDWPGATGRHVHVRLSWTDGGGR